MRSGFQASQKLSGGRGSSTSSSTSSPCASSARTQARGQSWLAVESSGRGFLLPLREAGLHLWRL